MRFHTLGALLIAGCMTHHAAIAGTPCPGDVDGDGQTGFNDVLSVLGDMCMPGGSSDLNGDGIVNVDDLHIVLGDYNCPPSPTPTSQGAFDVGDVDLGGTCWLLGQPILSDLGSNYFQHVWGDLNGPGYPPPAALVNSDPTLVYDSYVALGGRPIDLMAMDTAVHPDGTYGPVFPGAGVLTNGWRVEIPAASGVQFRGNPAEPIFITGNQAVFIARLTLPAGECVSGDRVRALILDDTGWRTVSMVVNGPSVTVDDFGVSTEMPYRVRAYETGRANIPGYGFAATIDVYIEEEIKLFPFGDVTDDCSVDINDLNEVLGNFGTVGGPIGGPGDGNNNGDVDINDLNLVLGNFGLRCCQ